jgi:hypothetical protein
MNENTIKAVADIFKGKGGGLRLAMVGLFILGVISQITDSDYEFEAGTSDGNTVSLKPHQGNGEDESNEDNTNDRVESGHDRDDQEQTV